MEMRLESARVSGAAIGRLPIPERKNALEQKSRVVAGNHSVGIAKEDGAFQTL
jgi:hypothetical protein